LQAFVFRGAKPGEERSYP